MLNFFLVFFIKKNLFNSQKDLKRAEQDSLKQKIKQSQKQIEGLEAKKVSLIKTLEFIKLQEQVKL